MGTWITLGHPAVAEIMAKSGFDWVTIDLEHSVIDLFDAENLIRTIDLSGSIPLVRLPSNDNVMIKRMLDAGCGGIIIPQINTADDLRLAIESAHYPIKGTRGAGLARAQGYGDNFNKYKQFVDAGVFIVAQIEHIDAVKNLNSILEVDGLDAIIIGPYDLSASMGKAGDLDNADVQSAARTILREASERNISCGIHIIEPNIEELATRKKQGFTFVAYSLDIRMIDSLSRQAVSCKDI